MNPSQKTVDDVMRISIARSIKHRLPWLFLGLVGGTFAAHIINAFDKVLKGNLALAAFIPLIVYISDAVGTQMESFAIRDFALHPRRHFLKYFLKQLTVTLVIGIILSLALLFYVLVSKNDFHLALVLAISLIVSTSSSVLTGLVLPQFFSKAKLDPANASGPIATIIQDILSVTIYFTIASILL